MWWLLGGRSACDNDGFVNGPGDDIEEALLHYFRYPYPTNLILSISSWLNLVHLMNYVVRYIYTLALPVIAVKVLREPVFFGF